MREEEFTMERDILNVGDTVRLTEGKLPFAYYYTAEPAAAMSGNFPSDSRILSDSGTVTAKRLDGDTWIVTIAVEK